MFNEFKQFAMKGNVVDLAVAVIIGGAFGKIVTSLVNDIVMPAIGAFGGVDFTNLMIKVGQAEIMYGNFIQSIVDFLIIAFAIFLVVRQLNKMKKEEPAAPAKKPDEVLLLEEIRDLLRK